MENKENILETTDVVVIDEAAADEAALEPIETEPRDLTTMEKVGLTAGGVFLVVGACKVGKAACKLAVKGAKAVAGFFKGLFKKDEVIEAECEELSEDVVDDLTDGVPETSEDSES